MNVIDWLLDSDPAIRWQVLRDLTDAAPEDVAAERARVAHEGWGKRLLDLQHPDGSWAGGAYFPSNHEQLEHQAWTATSFSLQQLRDFGVDPSDYRVKSALALVRANVKWEYDGSDYFDGEVEPCINGLAVALGAYFGENVRPIVDLLVSEQLEDGGWNCDVERGSVRSSFHTTIAVLDGLLQYENSYGADSAVTASRSRAHEYLLDRHLFRRLSTGEVADDEWLQFMYPNRWRYDVLRGLDYLRAAGVEPDSRLDEAIALVESKRTADGRWLLENSLPGEVHFTLDAGDGHPSRWNTLRALRVLRWFRGVN